MPSSTKPTWQQWLKLHQAETLIEVSEEFGRQLWQPTEADRSAAWSIYTQLRSRIATQPLHYRDGDEETAIDSLYRLFQLARDTIETNGHECRDLALITTQVLNRHIRPITAKWHKKKVEGRLRNDDDRREFRRELDRLRPTLQTFCSLLASMAAATPKLLGDEGCAQSPHAGTPHKDSGAIAFDGAWMNAQLYQSELGAIKARRESDEPVTDVTGLAFSGGGIRSATFCLGVTQALARRGVLADIDYLSTVSGGGYLGSFLSSYLNDPDREAIGLEKDKLPFSRNGDAEPAPVRHLRNDSKFLLKGGLFGRLRMLGLMSLGILVNLLAVAPVMLIALFVAKWMQAGGVDAASFAAGTATVLKLLFGLLIAFVVVLPVVYRRRATDKPAIAKFERIGIVLLIAIAAIWFVASVMPMGYAYLRSMPFTPPQIIGIFAALPFAFAAAGFLLGLEKLPGKILMTLAGITGPLFLLMTFIALNELIPSRDGSNALILMTSAVIVYAWLSQINVNQISPHRYYRNRLAETYLLRRRKKHADADLPVETVDPQPLSKLRADNPKAPYHLINTAVNLPASKNAELRGRRSDFFVFTQHHCGSPLVGYCPIGDMEAKDPHVDLGTAMAISGAAASSFMGTKTFSGLSFWLALLNVRLAYWLPNPARLSNVRTTSGASPLAVWRELFAKLDERSDYVNLSDGGHIENLGIYELLRRKCKFVVAVDGEADPQMTFGSLMQLIRFAQIDLGVEIKLDLSDLTRNAQGDCKAHFAFGRILYGEGQTGYLLYIKSSLTGNERDYVSEYRQKCPDFPHETTADQFFSEAQFEAYRALGEHIGNDLFQSELIGSADNVTLRDWFSGMRRTLLSH